MKIRSSALYVLIVAACAGSESRPLPPGAAAFVMPTPDVGVLAAGESLTLAHEFHDSSGVVIVSGRPTFRTSNPAVATVSASGRVTATGLGEAEVLATMDGVSTSTRIRVVGDDASGVMLDIFPDVRHQTIRAWEGSAQIGEIDCHPAAFAKIRDELVHRVVNELGMTRLRVTLRSGTENRVDQWPLYRAGRINYPVFRRTWFRAANDNDDPFVADPAGFQWSFLDHAMDTVVAPFRKALAARGERLSLNLNYVDFWLGDGTKEFSHFTDPEEYAELVRVVFDHLNERFGYTPDALELNLEPENTPHSAVEMGRALVATKRRLQQGGYAPEFIAPSATRAANAPVFYDAMLSVPGARGLVTELAYHRYTGVSDPTLKAILLRARRDGAATAMLEQIDGGFDALYNDLTVADASSWEQFAVAYCGPRNNPSNGGVYYQVNDKDPANPVINITYEARLLRQVFMYVRPGAVRLGTEGNDRRLRGLAFRNADGRVVVIGRAIQELPFSIRGLPAGTYGVNYSTRTGKHNVDLPDVRVDAGKPLQLKVPADAAITLYGR